MKSTDRILGALEESKDHFEKRFDRFEDYVGEEFKAVRKEISALQKIHWKSVGAKSVWTGILIIIIDVFFH